MLCLPQNAKECMYGISVLTAFSPRSDWEDSHLTLPCVDCVILKFLQQKMILAYPSVFKALLVIIFIEMKGTNTEIEEMAQW